VLLVLNDASDVEHGSQYAVRIEQGGGHHDTWERFPCRNARAKQEAPWRTPMADAALTAEPGPLALLPAFSTAIRFAAGRRTGRWAAGLPRPAPFAVGLVDVCCAANSRVAKRLLSGNSGAVDLCQKMAAHCRVAGSGAGHLRGRFLALQVAGFQHFGWRISNIERSVATIRLRRGGGAACRFARTRRRLRGVHFDGHFRRVPESVPVGHSKQHRPPASVCDKQQIHART
jgi:hypothetical protein